MASDTYEADITPFVTAGQSHNLDYGVASASGSSNYIVNNQLVTYGATNFSNDASIVDIVQPSNYIEYRRDNPMCGNAKVRIRNTGSTALTSLTIEYWINDDQNHQTYQWNGSLEFLEEEIVEIPASNALWQGINGQTTSKFHATVSNPNNGSDEYAHNNTTSSEFTIPDILPAHFYIYFTSNNAPAETKYELFDELGNSLFVRDNMTATTNYKDTFNLSQGCYKLVFTDTGDDGISFWANNDGSGVARIRQVMGPTLTYFEGDFGGSLTYYFTIDSPLSYDEFKLMQGVKLYPNPTSNQFTIQGKKMDEAIIDIYNSMGQKVNLQGIASQEEIQYDASNLNPGLYLIKIRIDDYEFTERLMVK